MSSWLRDQAAGNWRRMQEHRFVRAIEEDRLPEPVLRRYLVNEYAFVETAVTIFGYAFVKAPDIETRRGLLLVLVGLTADQIGYFERAFGALGMARGEWSGARLPAKAAMLRDGMLGYAAHGDFLDIATAMLVAEWTYHEFCQRAAGRAISHPILREWIELHAAPNFAAQAQFLRDRVDTLGQDISPERRRQLLSVFETALELEIHFHDAPLEVPGSPADQD